MVKLRSITRYGQGRLSICICQIQVDNRAGGQKAVDCQFPAIGNRIIDAIIGHRVFRLEHAVIAEVHILSDNIGDLRKNVGVLTEVVGDHQIIEPAFQRLVKQAAFLYGRLSRDMSRRLVKNEAFWVLGANGFDQQRQCIAGVLRGMLPALFAVDTQIAVRLPEGGEGQMGA